MKNVGKKQTARTAEQDNGMTARAPGPTGPDWYQRVYFEKRLEEEFYRARRYHIAVSLVLLRLPEFSRDTAYLLRSLVANQLRVIDLFGLLGDGDYAICLPHTDQAGAEVVAARVRAYLAGFSPSVGVATFGEDGNDFPGLLAAAEHRLA